MAGNYLSTRNNFSDSYNSINYYIDRFKLKFDDKVSLREKKLTILHKFLDGSIYDNLEPFQKEYYSGNSGKYIPLSRRRPAVQFNLCQIIANDSVAMLFGEGHFPTIRCADDENTQKYLQYITRKSNLQEAMLEGAKVGSIGSVCIAVKLLKEKFYFEVLQTKDISPTFDPLDPNELIETCEKRTVDGGTLVAEGYDIKDEELNEFFYVIRKWTKEEEIFYMPYLCDKDEGFIPTKDEEKTCSHNFGFVPCVWIKNLPSTKIDGISTFGAITDIQIEIDYQESQLGRLFKYNSDPTLVVKNPSGIEGDQFIKSVGILNLDEGGDAYYAEMSGKSSDSVMSYIKQLREHGLEVCRGNRTSPDKINNAQSGKALEMLNMPLIGLVGEMRLTYGKNGLLRIYEMVLEITKLGTYKIKSGKTTPGNLEDYDLTLDWPDWYPQSSQEKLQESQSLTTLTNNKIISKETALNNIADEYNILDVQDETKKIDADAQKEIANNNKLKDNNTLDKVTRGARAKK